MIKHRHITFSKSHWDQMQNHVAHEVPLEACGIIGGRDDQCLKVFETRNILQSPTRFQIDPKQQIQAFHYLDQQGWDFIGTYHSHPIGPPKPSLIDIQEAHYPNSVNLIWSHQKGLWDCQAFLINYGKIYPIEILLKNTGNFISAL